VVRKKNDPPLLFEFNERITRLETDMTWVKDKLKCLDKRLWYILTGIVISILLTIMTVIS